MFCTQNLIEKDLPRLYSEFSVIKSRLDDHCSDLPLKYDHLATPPWILKEDDEDDDYDEEIPEQD